MAQLLNWRFLAQGLSFSEMTKMGEFGTEKLVVTARNHIIDKFSPVIGSLFCHIQTVKRLIKLVMEAKAFYVLSDWRDCMIC